MHVHRVCWPAMSAEIVTNVYAVPELEASLFALWDTV